MIPKRIQMTRNRPWRAENPDAIIVARPSKFGNIFIVGKALVREPAVLDPSAQWEYEGRISQHGLQHDYHHPDGRITPTWVRKATPDECVTMYEQLLTGELTPSMRASGLRSGLPSCDPYHRIGISDVIAELRGRVLACWCRPDRPCHADPLLRLANQEVVS